MYDDVILAFAIIPLAALLLPVRILLAEKKKVKLAHKITQAMTVLLGLQLAFMTAYIIRIWNTI